MSDEQEISFTDGDSYEKWMGVWSQLIGNQFLEWLSPQPGKTWVDIGCGNGTFTEQIYSAHSPQEIQGIDPSPEQIDFALKRVADPSVTFQLGDAMDLPFESDRFDYATMALVLFFVPDPAVGVAEMIRVAKPGGNISAYVWDVLEGGAPMVDILDQFRVLEIDHPYPPSSEVSRMERLEETWLEAGLENIETKRISVQRTYENFADYWDLTSRSANVSPILSQLSSDMSDRVKKMTQDSLGVDHNESVTVDAFANAVKGTV